MYLTTNNRIKTKNKLKLLILKELTRNSKDLYNKALYKVRQYFIKNKKYLSYKDLYPLMKMEPEYTRLPSNVSQQTLKSVDNAFKSFFNALKAKQQGKNDNKIKIPGYLDKNGHYKLIYTKIHLKRDGNYIRLSLPKSIKENLTIHDAMNIFVVTIFFVSLIITFLTGRIQSFFNIIILLIFFHFNI